LDTYLAVASKRDWRSYAGRPVPEDIQQRILDAGRLTGSAVNKQPWTFVVVESDDAKARVAETVYASGNILGCAFAVAIATEGGKYPFDCGRAMQNMMLAAWNEGVVSCPNGMPRSGGGSRSPRSRRRLAPGQHSELRLPQAPARP
jgi:nitroreductase